MRLRTFTADSISAAMSRIRTEMGPDAIIISNVSGKRGKGVVVTAAVEPPTDHRRQDPPRPAVHTMSAAPVAPPAGEEDEALDLEVIEKALIFHRLPTRLAGNLKRASAAMDAENNVLALGGALDTAFSFSQLADIPQRPLMLVGPPGGGKTLATAKLAARALISGARIRIGTTDTVRAGGPAALKVFAERLDSAVASIATADQLDSFLTAFSGHGDDCFTIIDSQAINPLNRSEMDDFLAFTKGQDIEPVLVVAAGGDPWETADQAQQFARLGVRRLIVTRIDASRRLGNIIAAAQAAKLSIAEIGRSPFVSDGLEAATPVALARLLLSTACATGKQSQLKAARQ